MREARGGLAQGLPAWTRVRQGDPSLTGRRPVLTLGGGAHWRLPRFTGAGRGHEAAETRCRPVLTPRRPPGPGRHTPQAHT